MVGIRFEMNFGMMFHQLSRSIWHVSSGDKVQFPHLNRVSVRRS